MGLIVAGARSTGRTGNASRRVVQLFANAIGTASWMFIYLGNSLEWRAKAAAEVESVLFARPPPSGSSYSLAAHLATVPLEVWESETPVLDALIRETLRIAQPHTAMRK